MEKFLKDYPLDLNRDSSDVITGIRSGLYKNLSTGKTGRLIEVIRDRNFISLCTETCGYYGGPEKYGYYAHHDKEHDVLITAEAYYDSQRGWIESSRHLFFHKDGAIAVCNYPGDAPFDYRRNGVCFDICGQSPVITYVEDGEKNITFLSEHNPRIDDSGFISACISFFEKIEPVAPYSFADGWESIRKVISFSISPIRLVNETETTVLGSGIALPIPKEAEEIMKKFVIAFVECNYTSERICRIPDTGYLCRDGDEIFCRLFEASVIFKYPLNRSVIKLTESKRVFIEEGKEVYNDDFPEIVYMDDMSGTFIEYTVDVIKLFIEYFKEKTAVIEDKGESGWETKCQISEDFFDEMLYEFWEQNNFSCCEAVPFAKRLAENPLFEMMFKYTGPNSWNVRNSACSYLAAKNETPYFDSLLNDLSDGSSIHEILGAPKAILECIPDDGWLDGIQILKTLFCSKEANAYFLRMNKADLQEFYDFLYKACCDDEIDNVCDILRKLFMLHGFKNWKGYIDQIMDISCDDDGCCEYYSGYYEDSYIEYLDMLLALGDIGKKADWKLGRKEIIKATESLEEAYNLKTDQAANAAADTAIASRIKEMEEMTFEKGQYIVTYPKKADDILTEGVTLKHCAKQFIQNVAYGSTMLLFIREKSEPGKPFFTLEVKNKRMRQCHGFANRSIYTQEGMEEFLKDYCKEKGIEFFKEDLTLGV